MSRIIKTTFTRSILLFRRSTQLHSLQSKAISTKPATPTSQSELPLLSLQYDDDLFNFTRGRFVIDEAYEMAQRHVEFDVNELARVAAKSVGATSCISIKKYPDGMFNKAMLLTMNNGTEVVAKVPNPNAGHPHHTTASEVATMDFVRNILQTPVPKILAWNSTARESPVGTEYIIMEKVQGIELEEVWPSMKLEDRLAVIQNIASYQKSWTSCSFTKYGSLYYSEDLDERLADEVLYTDADGVAVKNSRFAIGPTTGRDWVDENRADVKCDRGPWQTVEEYHTAIGNREIAAVTQLPHLPKSSISIFGPGTYIPTKERKLKALHHYIQLLPYLIPSDALITSSHIWHSDLHVANIFVNPSKPTEITGLIDWQSTELCPLYFHARKPHFLDYDGPQHEGLDRPKLPKNFSTLEGEEKSRVELLYYQQSLCAMYNTIIRHKNPRVYSALEFIETMSFTLLLIPRTLLVDGEATYLAQVAALEEVWDTIPGNKGAPYPFSFSSEERIEISKLAEGAELAMEAMNSVEEAVGNLFPVNKCVRAEVYESSLDALAQAKEQIIEQLSQSQEEREIWEKYWPFGT